MAPVTETQTLEETLNKTDLGHYLYEYRKVLLVVVLVIFAGAGGWVMWKKNQQSAALVTAQEIYNFQTTTWEEVKEGKKTIQDLQTAYQGLSADLKKSALLWPVVMEMTAWLSEKAEYKLAQEMLAGILSQNIVGPADFFLTMQLVAIEDKIGEHTTSIGYLEKLAQKKETLMPGKVYLELGRLYNKAGKTQEAKTQFEFILSNYPNDEYANSAKLYLAEMVQL